MDEPVWDDGSTPLLRAAFEGDVEEARRLIKAGADVRAMNPFGVNAMQLAADIGPHGAHCALAESGCGS